MARFVQVGDECIDTTVGDSRNKHVFTQGFPPNLVSRESMWHGKTDFLLYLEAFEWRSLFR
jgi:hypothetical protein